jgi:hypothetical protein
MLSNATYNEFYLFIYSNSNDSQYVCLKLKYLCLIAIVDEVTIVETPGVLSGEKQRTQRSYDFPGVVSWFIAKCDVILLLFDPHKLDISDEFKRVIHLYVATRTRYVWF